MKKILYLSLLLFHSEYCLSEDFTDLKISDEIILFYETPRITQKTTDYIKEGYLKLKTYFGYSLKKPVKIYIISSKEKYNLYFNIPNRDLTSGFAKLNTNEIYVKAPAMLRYNIFDFEKIIVHELAHIFIENFSYPHTPPRWLHEGLAMKLEPVWYWLNFRSIVLPYAFLSNQIIPFRNLKSFPPEKNLLLISYEQSSDFINYISKNYGEKKLLLLLKNYRETGSIDSAVILTYNQPLDEIEYMWAQSLKTKYTWFYILRQTNFFWFLVSLAALCGYFILKIRRKKEIVLLDVSETEDILPEDDNKKDDIS